MTPFSKTRGVLAPMAIANINTDDIFPGPTASPVLRGAPGGVGMTPETAGVNAFATMRFHADGSINTAFILNQHPFDAAVALLGGDNFGCGSSRELAVWALKGIGLRCVIALSFGDIFYDNCIKNGVLPARIGSSAWTARIVYISQTVWPIVEIDLETCTLWAGEDSFDFMIGEYPRRLLLEGADEIDIALSSTSALNRFEAGYSMRRPWLNN